MNRALVLLRRFFGWLTDQGHVPANPAKSVKELKRQQLAPKGLDRSQVRRLLREVELREDIRAGAVFSLMLYTGCRVGDLANLELNDVMLGDRSGSVVFRSRQRATSNDPCRLPLPARRALQAWLDVRPSVASSNVFVGERGPLTDRGIRALCDKYSAICGFKIHPHLLRHTMAHRFLDDNGNDLVSSGADLRARESRTRRSGTCRRTEEQLAEAAERLSF